MPRGELGARFRGVVAAARPISGLGSSSRRALGEFEQAPLNFVNCFILPSLQEDFLAKLMRELAWPRISSEPNFLPRV
ncbi:MAG: hypothetical protein AMK72_02970 [Planctomycetes bacterium SM23_25]|nr:MAG: hypothetical protein AMK72_02970 [Planctomycetes bacterium SM23_25]